MDGIGSAQGRVHSASATVRHPGTCPRESRATPNVNRPRSQAAGAVFVTASAYCSPKAVAYCSGSAAASASKAAFSSGVISLMVSFTRLRLSMSSTLTMGSSPSLRKSRTSLTRSGTI